MATTEEKLLTLLVSAEHLKETAKEQQKAVADSLAVARKTLKRLPGNIGQCGAAGSG